MLKNLKQIPHKGVALALVALVLVALYWQNRGVPDITEVPLDERAGERYRNVEPDMLAAIIKAQSTLDEFLELAESPPEGARSFSVKVQVEQGEQREYLWAYPFSKEPNGFVGRLNDVPESLRGFSEGEEVLFQREDIVDWTYDDAATDTMHGNYTGCVALRREAPEHAEQFQELYGLDCDW